MTTLERAVRSANFVVEGSQGKNHNVDVEEIVRDVLETVRVDMNLMLQVGREIGVQPSVVGLCWTRCIDAILGPGVSRETGTSSEGGKINTTPSGRQED